MENSISNINKSIDNSTKQLTLLNKNKESLLLKQEKGEAELETLKDVEKEQVILESKHKEFKTKLDSYNNLVKDFQSISKKEKALFAQYLISSPKMVCFVLGDDFLFRGMKKHPVRRINLSYGTFLTELYVWLL